MKTNVPFYAALLTVSTLIACKASVLPFARLESAVVNDRYDATPSPTAVRIVRADSTVTPATSLRLRSGDSIATSRDARVVLEFAAGYEVTLDTGSVIYMLESGATDAGSGSDAASFSELRNSHNATGTSPFSALGARPLWRPGVAGSREMAVGEVPVVRGGFIFLRIGRAFIRRLRNTPDTLDTRTPQAVLHDAGTEYVVTVSAAQTGVRVVNGEVIASSGDGRWNAVRYGPGSGGVLRVDAAPQRTTTATPAQLEAELGWVRRVERLTKVAVPSLDSLTEQQARDSLGRVGLRVLLTMQRESAAYSVGRVIETMPAAGERVAPNTYITLVLAKAPRAELCAVPDITEKTERVALQLLTRANLKGQRTSSVGEIDVVTSQVEKAGTRIRCGSSVRYTWGRLR